MSQFRVYFYDTTGKELTAHPLNGKAWIGNSGWVRNADDTEFKRGYHSSVTVANWANLHMIDGEQLVTIADFAGMDRVGVKVWYSPESSDKFWLVAPDHFANR